MARILEVRSEDTDDFGGTTKWVIPGSSGSRSAAPYKLYSSNPAVNGLPGATRISWSTNPVVAHRRNSYAKGIRFEDYLNAASNLRPRMYFKLNAWPNNTVSVPLTRYSLRMYHSYFDGAYADAPCHLLSFRGSNTDRFSIMLGGYSLRPGGNIFNQYDYDQFNPYVNGLTNRDFTLALYNGTTWRTEVQVDSTANPKVTIKFYIWNSTTAYRTITCNPTNVSTDEICIGAVPGLSGAYQAGMWINDIEVFDSYDLDGTVGQHYDVPYFNAFGEYNGTTEIAVQEGGTYNSSNSTETTSDKKNFHDKKREMVLAASFYTKVADINYDNPSRAFRNMDLYYPNSTPPSGGWPVVLWAHSGFFSSGDKNQISDGWLKMLLWNGYAVVNLNYVLGQAIISSSLPQPNWFASGAGKFPTFGICYKLAGLWVQQKGSVATGGDGTYPLNSQKMCASGYSAGGNAALTAAVSKDLTNHYGYNLTVNHPTYGYRSNTPDPLFKCCYVYGAPTDMWLGHQYDPTHPDFGAANSGVGILRNTARSFLGRYYNVDSVASDFTGTDVASMVTAQSLSNLPPIGYEQGRGDWLVHWEHAEALRSALQLRGRTMWYTVNNAFHDEMYNQFSETSLLEFLKSSGM